MQSFPDAYFDWIYIDAQHTYEDVKRDIAAAAAKVKSDGFLVFNDYTMWSYVEMQPYGVVAAVNEFCIEHDWGFAYLTLSDHLYCDVAARKMNAFRQSNGSLNPQRAIRSGNRKLPEVSSAVNAHVSECPCSFESVSHLSRSLGGKHPTFLRRCLYRQCLGYRGRGGLIFSTTLTTTPPASEKMCLFGIKFLRCAYRAR